MYENKNLKAKLQEVNSEKEIGNGVVPTDGCNEKSGNEDQESKQFIQKDESHQSQYKLELKQDTTPV